MGTLLSECCFLPRADVGVCPHTEAVPGGGLVAQLGLAQHREATLYRWRGGRLTVVGPPSAGERGRVHSEVAPTTFLSWQPCTLSSGPEQANGFAAALPSPGVNEAHA